MCHLYSLNQVFYLREVELYCSLTYKKMCRSHNFSAIISEIDYKINQCAEETFTMIETKNVYMDIAQRYVTFHHERFGCSVRSFLALLGCLLHYLIPLLEEDLSRRNIVQGIQESFEILCHLYKMSSKHIDLRVNLKIEKTGEYILSKIQNYVINRFQGNEEDSTIEHYADYINELVEKLCHYESTNMKEILGLLVKEFIMFRNNKGILSNTSMIEESHNPLSNIGAILSHTFKSENDLSKSSLRLINFKEDNKTLTYLVCTQSLIENEKEFSINSGILVTIKEDTARVLNKSIGLRNCLLFAFNLEEADSPNMDTSSNILYTSSKHSAFNEHDWRYKFIVKINEAQVNCILLSGTCDNSLKNELQLNMEISVLEGVPRKALEIIADIMDVDVHENTESIFSASQLLINVLQMTTLDRLILCSIHIPKWMEIFGVSYVNLKTVLVRHSSIMIAKAMFESFKHNLRRIENAFSLGCYLSGGGKLESKFAKELNARANDKIINNMDSEPIEQKCRVMLAITKGLELYHLHLSSNIAEDLLQKDDVVEEKLDDLESKVGGAELLSQCLTSLFSTNLMICSLNEAGGPLKI